METSYTLSLKDISYMGANVGNDWEFTITVSGKTVTFPALLSFGATRTFDKLLFDGNGDPSVNAMITLPIAIGAVERDPSQDDTGSISGTFRLDLTNMSEQTQQFSLVVKEARKSSKAGAEGVLLFTFAVQAGTTAPVKIDSVTPGRGPLSGATLITINGAGFVSGSQVFFGKVPAASVEFVDEKTLKAVSPAKDEPGAVSIKVETPAGNNATLRNAFVYEGKPEIRYIDPNEGPVTPDAAKPYLVFIYGKNFQDGATVFFGDVAAKTLEVAIDGARIKVELPAAEMPGEVDVRVQNPDNTKVKMEKGFRYLAKDEKGRARIRKFEPLQLIDGEEPVTVKVTGRRLIEANQDHLFCLRTPDTVDLVMGDVTPDIDDETGEETLTFTLSAKSRSFLLYTSRTMIQFMVSVREHAVDDLVAEETNKFLTLLPARRPVPLGYTSAISSAGSQMLMVAGRNLQGTTLKLKGSKGIEMMEGHSEDKVSVLLIRVADPSQVVPGSLELSDASGRVAKYPLEMGALLPQETPGEEPSIGQLVQVPGQKVAAPQNGKSTAWLLRTKLPLKRSDPKFDGNTNFVADYKFTIATFEIVIPILDDVVFFNVADRGGKEIVEKGLNLSVGRILRVRNLDFLVVLQVNLIIRTEVFFFLFINPFADLNSDASFDAFSPLSPPGTFGSVVTSLQVKTTFEFRILFFAALVLPPVYNPDVYDPAHPERFPEILNPLRPEGLRLQVVAAFFLDLEIRNTSQGAQLQLGGGVYVRVVLPLYKYAAKITTFQSDGLELLATFAYPDPAGLGLVAYFFAREAGKYCFDWERDGIQPKIGLLSSPEEEVDLQIPTTTTFCLEVQENKELIVYRPIPKSPSVELNASQLFWVYRARVRQNDPDKKETIDYDNVPDPAGYKIISSDPSILITKRDDCKESPERIEDWLLFGKKTGSVKLSIQVDPNIRNAAPGTVPAGRAAFLPTRDIHFDPFPNILFGLFPTITTPLSPDPETNEYDARVVAISDGTMALQIQRYVLWVKYVRQTAGDTDPEKAWDALPCSAKGIFLVHTHRLFYSVFTYAGTIVPYLELNGKRMLPQVDELLALRGMLKNSCNDPDANRMFVRFNLPAAEAIWRLPKRPSENTLRIIDNPTHGYPGEFGRESWRRVSASSPKVANAIETPTSRPPKTSLLLLDEPDFPEAITKDTLARFSAAIAELSRRTAVEDGAIFRDTIIEKNAGTTSGEGNPVCVLEAPRIAELVTDFGSGNCTEIMNARIRFIFDKKKYYPGTGRRMYDFNYGDTITPVDFGWSPKPITFGTYTRNAEEARGENGVEDRMISLDTDDELESFPRMRTIVDTFESRLNAVKVTDPDVKDRLVDLVRIFGKNILMRARLTARLDRFSRADDRPLYWARIKMTVLLRNHPYMLLSPESKQQQVLLPFEEASRGYDIRFPEGNSVGRIIITGFDPFGLDDNIEQSNPSGALALALHDSPFTIQGLPAVIHTIILPVRRRDFDQDCGEGVVESVLGPLISEINEDRKLDLLLTTSQGEGLLSGPLALELDRFACRTRSKILDNENTGGDMITFPANVPGDEFYSTTLPVKNIIDANSNGLFFKRLYVNRFKFSYESGGTKQFAFCDYVPDGNEDIETRKDADTALFKPPVSSSLTSTTTPRKQDITSITGSGGAFLSNEVFYRTARLREMYNTQLMSGHFHLPRVQQGKDQYDAKATMKVINEMQFVLLRIFAKTPAAEERNDADINVI